MSAYLWALNGGEFFLYYGEISKVCEKHRYSMPNYPKTFRRFRGRRADDPNGPRHVLTVGPNEGVVYSHYVWQREKDFEKAKQAFILWENQEIERLNQTIELRKQWIKDIEATTTYRTK